MKLTHRLRVGFKVQTADLRASRVRVEPEQGRDHELVESLFIHR